MAPRRSRVLPVRVLRLPRLARVSRVLHDLATTRSLRPRVWVRSSVAVRVLTALSAVKAGHLVRVALAVCRRCLAPVVAVAFQAFLAPTPP